MNNIFITGGTGFLGSLFIKEILDNTDCVLHVLARSGKSTDRKKELISILAGLGEKGRSITGKIEKRLHLHTGDITKKNLGLGKDSLAFLVESVDTMFHMAATTDLNKPIEMARKVNVEGTRNVLDIAALCRRP